MEYKQDFDKDILFIKEILIYLNKREYLTVEEMLEHWRMELTELRSKEILEMSEKFLNSK